MCGIAGIWNFDGKPISDETIIKFTDTLSHRGPDGRGIWHNEHRNLAFGHRRLAIIDLSHEADQPLHYADNRYHIVFNGEIYNFIEVRDELKLKGYVFKTDSDTEVILAAYHAWNENMQFKFNGMWAIVIYDSFNEICFISRDRFGIKPFLYRLNQQQFAFASELKSFLKLDGFNPTMDETSSSQYLKTGFGVEGSKHTMLKEVKKLQAGCCGIVKDGNVQIKRWWKTSDHLISVPESFEEQAKMFKDLFYDSIKLRMRSDVSIGSCLSGGFDSSAVVCALAEIGKKDLGERQSKEWQQTFVATFPGKSNDERPQAEEVIKFAGVKGHFFEVKEDESLQLLNQVLHDFDDVYVGIPVSPWLIYRELRRNNIVVSLDGHGADELMGAYMPASGAYLANSPSIIGNMGYVNNLLKQANQLNHTTPSLTGNLNLLYNYHPDFALARNAFKIAKKTKDKYLSSTSSGIMLHEALMIDTTEFDEDEEDLKQFDETTRNLYRMFHYDVLPTILRNFDRMSMAHGIEIRMPFMDWRLVQFVFSLPGGSKIKEGYTKRIAREAMKDKMPENIRDSKVKIGFNSPMPEWFNSTLQPWINETLSGISSNSLVDVVKLKTEIQKHNQLKDWNWSNTGNTWKYLHYLWFENNFLKK